MSSTGVSAIAVSHNSRYVAITTGTGGVYIWDTKQKQSLSNIDNYLSKSQSLGFISSIIFSKNDKNIIVAYHDGGVAKFIVSSSACVYNFHPLSTPLLPLVSLSDSGRNVLIGNHSTLSYRQANRKKIVGSWKLPITTCRIEAVSENGKYYAVQEDDGKLLIYNFFKFHHLVYSLYG